LIQQRESRLLAILALSGAASVIAVCLLEVLGPSLGLSDSNIDPFGTSAMKYNSALGLTLSAVSVMILGRRGHPTAATPSVFILGVLVLALGGVTLTEYLLRFDLGIDRMAIGWYGGLAENPQAGRMSATSAYCFALAGSALIVAARRGSARYRLPLYSGLAAALLIVGCFNILGHLGETQGRFSWWTEAGIAITPALGFSLFGASMIALALSESEFSWSLSPRMTLGFCVGVLLMLFSTSVAFNYTVILREASERVSQTQEVLRDVQDSRAALATLMGLRRASLASGDGHTLDGLEGIVRGIRSNIGAIFRLTADNPTQQERLKKLELVVLRELRLGTDALGKGRDSAPKGEVIGAGVLAALAQADGILRAIGDEEFVLLGRRSQAAGVAGKMTLVLLPLGVLVSLTTLSVGLFVLNGSYNDRKEAEAKSRKLAAIVESSDDGMIGKDLNSVITSWNHGAEVLFGYSAPEVLGRSIMLLIPVERQAEESLILGRIVKGEAVRHFETVRRRKDGTLVDVSVTVSPIKDPAGRIVGASKVVRDITERKQTEAKIHELNLRLEERVQERTAQLEAANKELEAFSYSVSHDLRAPLRAMDGFSQAVLEDYGNQVPEEGRRYLQVIRDGAQRMGALIDDLLAFARLSRAPIAKAPLDMAKLVGDVLEELDAKSGRPGLQVSVGPMPMAQGDPALVRQVWVNLISNALKYSQKRDVQVVEIGSQTREGRDVFYVRDNGTGFDMQYVDKLFGVFQRLHRSDEYEGTGVGLAIVQRVVHRHGGEVWAEAAVDRGATFYFNLGGKTSHE